MNRMITTAALLLLTGTAWADPSAAVGSRDLGIGIVVGDPTGATAKVWLADTRALDFGIGSGGNLEAYGDYLLHSWGVFPQPAEGRLAAYAGLGLGMVARHDDSRLEFRIPVGVTYLPHSAAIEVFFELVPVVELSPDNGSDLDVGLGFRFYFPPSKR